MSNPNYNKKNKIYHPSGDHIANNPHDPSIIKIVEELNRQKTITDFAKGEKGDIGPTGPEGIQGDDGIIGPTGPQGTQGTKGEVGSTGSKGQKGFYGPQGDKGSLGTQGIEGPTGPQGTQGTQGIQGTKGQKGGGGSQGIQGTQGTEGPAGSFGGASFTYVWNNTYASADGIVNIQNDSFLLITKTDEASDDLSNYLITIDDSTSDIKGHFKISKIDADYEFKLYTITQHSVGIDVIQSYTNYYKVQISQVSGDSTLNVFNGDSVVVTFARTGDVGAKGAKGGLGSSGTKGQKGELGISGDKGNTGTSISTISQSENNLIVQLDDFTSSTFYDVKGAKGEIGTKGQTGTKGQSGAGGGVSDFNDLTSNPFYNYTDSVVVSMNIIPDSSLTYTLGSNTNRFKSLYLDSSAIYLGTSILEVSDSNLLLDGKQIKAAEGLDSVLIYKYFIDPPKAPTNISNSNTSTKIIFKWDNIHRIQAGFEDKELPYIQYLGIDYKLSSAGSWTTANETIGDSVTTAVFNVGGSGSSVSTDSFMFNGISNAVLYDFRVYGINHNNKTKNYLLFEDLSTTLIGSPGQPTINSFSSTGTVSTNMSITKPTYTDVDNSEATDPPIDSYRKSFRPSSTLRYGGLHSTDSVVTAQAGNNATTSLSLSSMIPGTYHQVKITARNDQNSNYGVYSSIDSVLTDYPSQPSLSTSAFTVNSSGLNYQQTTVQKINASGNISSANYINSITTGDSVFFNSNKTFLINSTVALTNTGISTIKMYVDGGELVTKDYDGFSRTQNTDDALSSNSGIISIANADHHSTSSSGFWRKGTFNIVLSQLSPSTSTKQVSFKHYRSASLIATGGTTSLYIGETTGSPTLDSVIITSLTPSSTRNLSGLNSTLAASIGIQYYVENVGKYYIISNRYISRSRLLQGSSHTSYQNYTYSSTPSSLHSTKPTQTLTFTASSSQFRVIPLTMTIQAQSIINNTTTTYEIIKNDSLLYIDNSTPPTASNFLVDSILYPTIGNITAYSHANNITKYHLQWVNGAYRSATYTDAYLNYDSYMLNSTSNYTAFKSQGTDISGTNYKWVIFKFTASRSDTEATVSVTGADIFDSGNGIVSYVLEEDTGDAVDPTGWRDMKTTFNQANPNYGSNGSGAKTGSNTIQLLSSSSDVYIRVGLPNDETLYISNITIS